MQVKNINIYIIFLPLLVFFGDRAFAEDTHNKSFFTGNDKIHLTQAGSHRFEFINDILNGSDDGVSNCLLYTSPSPRDQRGSRMPSSA